MRTMRFCGPGQTGEWTANLLDQRVDVDATTARPEPRMNAVKLSPPSMRKLLAATRTRSLRASGRPLMAIESATTWRPGAALSRIAIGEPFRHLKKALASGPGIVELLLEELHDIVAGKRDGHQRCCRTGAR